MNQEKTPTVSVIVPCYNHGRLIRETVESIGRQTYTDWECIIVNDGSTDNSEEVALQLAAEDPRVRYFSQPNKGPSGARNRGLEEIRGNYVQFLDADDTIADNKITLQIADLSTTSELALAYCDFWWCNEAGEKIEVPWQLRVAIDYENPLRDVALNWQHEIVIPPSCFLFDARFFTEHGIREDESIRANEDYDLMLSVLALKPRVFYQDQKLATYRIVEGSVSDDQARLRRTYFYILEKHIRIFADYEEMKAILREKKRIVKRDFWHFSQPYEIGWWLFKARQLARKILPPDSYQRIKRMVGRG